MIPITIAQNWQESKVCQQMDAGILQDLLPPQQIEEQLDAFGAWESRERKLNMVVMVYWLIALHLYPHLSQRDVYARLLSGLRRYRDDITEQIPVKSAFSYRREQLGSEVIEELFEQLAARPTPADTPGVCWKGLRLFCLDGTRESVPDTPANRIAFEYSTDTLEVRSPFPQARMVLLVECGTHLIVDAHLSSCREAEIQGARRLLERRSWEQTLVLWDIGFHAHRSLFQIRQTQGHVLGRLKKSVLLKPLVTLADGSYMVRIYEKPDHQRGPNMLVRVITYRLDDPRLPGGGEQVYRLVTTLLDPFAYPAKELAVLYHERWHAELVIGETRTVMRLSAHTLRSLTPQGVTQELYALVLAHTLVRRLLLQAAQMQGIAPTTLSFTAAIRLLDDNPPVLCGVSPHRRVQIVANWLEELGQQRLPRQRVRIQARVLKRAYPRYAHKKAEHWKAPPLELNLDFHQIVVIVV